MSKKKSKIKGRKLSTSQLQVEVLKLFKRDPKKRFNAKQVGGKLKVDNNKDSILHVLAKLVKEGQLEATDDYKFKAARSQSRDRGGRGRARGDRQTYEGRIDMTRQGAGYVIVEGLEQDIFIPPRRLFSALNGDIVRIEAWTPSGRRKPEGEVKEVIERASEHFIGVLHLSKKYGFVIPDKQDMHVDIYVDLSQIGEARNGDKVVVKITDWNQGLDRAPEGKITSTLGQVGSSDIEMKSILISAGFELEFPEEVIAESENVDESISAEEVAKRRDMRATPTFTIDPSDAKDFDDAISFEYQEDGNLEIGVHIADVSHYVKPGSALDKEAYKRSTSVYLVDRVLPMLPEKLSNGVCSLRPNEDKCTFSAVFTFDKNDKIVDRWFGKTLTHSDRRFTYNEAQEVMNTGEGDFAAELKKVNQIAKKYRKQRFTKGSIDFSVDEVKFKLDEDGTPIDVYIKERIDAHMLVEEYMLLANKEVALYIEKKAKGVEIPFVYRVHDEPNPDKVADLMKFAKQMGFEMNISSPDEIAKSFNKLTISAQEDDALKLLAPLAIRTMAKAEYSADNIGHYGLGFSHYSHFTSPIRRYSDVLAHRILEMNLKSEAPVRVAKPYLEEQCKHISLQERKATEAERNSIKYKQVEFIEKHIGETFEGQISGMIDRGFFVELVANQCEGMIGFDTLNEPFEIGEGRLMATGKRSKKVYRMGDRIQVVVIGADLQKRQIEMEMVVE